MMNTIQTTLLQRVFHVEINSITVQLEFHNIYVNTYFLHTLYMYVHVGDIIGMS